MKRLLVGCIALLGLLSQGATAHGAVQPSEAQAGAWRAWQANASSGTQIRWDEELGCPATIMRLSTKGERRPSITVPLDRVQALEAAQGFFDRNRALFSLREGIDAMVPKSDREWNGERFIRMGQRYRGVPVDDAGYTVTLGPDGEILMVNGRARAGIEVDITPRISAEDAGRAALRSLDPQLSRLIKGTNLIVSTDHPRGRLAWAVEVYSVDGSESWRVLVEAKSGRIIETRDQILRSHNGTRSTGSDPVAGGRPGSPIRDARRPAAPTPGFEDGGGGDEGGGGEQGGSCNPPRGAIYPTTPCQGGRIEIGLERLISPNFTLGTYVDAQPHFTRAQFRAYDPSGCQQFIYTPPDPVAFTEYDQTGFDDVNVYYHIDKALKTFWDDRFLFRRVDGNFNIVPLHAWTHAPLEFDEHSPLAWYNPSTGAIYFGDGLMEAVENNPAGFDAAKRAATIYHELSHSVMRDLGWTDAPTFLTQATGEGMADYFAATFLPGGAAEFGRCTYRTCPNEPLRRLDTDPNIYNYNFPGLSHTACGVETFRSDPHILGMVLSGAMWSIRSLVGVTHADMMAYRAIQSVYENATFFDIRDACYQYDYSYFFGDRHCELQSIFAARGLDVPPALLPAPSNVQATDGLCTVTVTWNFVTGASGYRVFRAGQPLTPDATAGQNSYPIPNPPTTPTLFEVRALNCVNPGAAGSDNGSRIPPPLPPPSCSATDATVDCKVVVTWTDVSGEDGYQVFRSGDLAGGTDPNVTSFNDVDAPQGVHTYTVQSRLCGANSGDSPSDAGSRKPPPAGPPSLSASDGIPDRVDLNWADVTGETGYKVFRGSQQLGPNLPAGATSYADLNPPHGRHVYSVKPISCEGDGNGASDEGYRQPPPIVVSISGPTSSNPSVSQTYTISVTGGLAPYSYQWTKYRDCPDPLATASPAGSVSRAVETPRLEQATCWEWLALSNTTNSVTVSDEVDFRVKCVVTDGAGATGFSQRNVDVAGAVGESQAPVTMVAATDGDPGFNKVNVTWGPSDGAEGFRVYRGGTLIATRTQNDRSYLDATAPTAISSYCVVAYSGAQNAAQVCDNGYPFVPLTGTISGPTTLNYGQTGTYNLNLSSGGIPPLTRQWYHATYCEDPTPGPASAWGGETIDVPPCDERYPFSTGGTSVNWTGSYDVEISCQVTDAAGRTIQPLLIVDVAGVIANQLAPDRELPDLGQFSAAPERTELLAIGNPVKSRTDVSFTLASPLHVRLDIFDVFGRRIETLSDEELPTGRHRVSWNAASHPAGMYLVRFSAGTITSTKRLLVVR